MTFHQYFFFLVAFCIVPGKITQCASPQNNTANQALIHAIKSNNSTAVYSALANGAFCNSPSYTIAPLTFALMFNYNEIATILIEYKADINTLNNHMFAPLSWAVQNNNKPLTRLLLDNHALIDITDRDGDSPLARAIELSYHEIIELLILAGADIHLKNKNNFTPLERASESTLLLISQTISQFVARQIIPHIPKNLSNIIIDYLEFP